jgi:hypothetical protein
VEGLVVAKCFSLTGNLIRVLHRVANLLFFWNSRFHGAKHCGNYSSRLAFTPCCKIINYYSPVSPIPFFVSFHIFFAILNKNACHVTLKIFIHVNINVLLKVIANLVA